MATREAFGQAIVELGELRPEVVVLDADVSKACSTGPFAKRFPDRSFNFGCAEQNMMTVAAGLASEGMIPFACTFAAFASMRACEMVRTFCCYTKLNVKIAASHAGINVGQDGPTHQAIEDINIMRGFPNMTIVAPADAVAAYRAVFAVADYIGPTYLRLDRNKTPVIYGEDYKFELGRADVILDEGCDLAVISAGVMVGRCLRAAETLKNRGIRVTVIDSHTIKPLDARTIVDVARRTGAVLTAEDHSIIGGLGTAVAEELSEEEPVLVKRLGIRDCFTESGPGPDLLDKYGLSVQAVADSAEALVRRKETR
ncbi:MAG: transketolase family protein [Armatimonadetes bacterium]|nr:transketolase family protein [Armatimonadota bacterium]